MVGPHYHACTKRLKTKMCYNIHFRIIIHQQDTIEFKMIEFFAYSIPGKYSFATFGSSYSERILSTPCFLRHIKDCDNISLAYNIHEIIIFFGFSLKE